MVEFIIQMDRHFSPFSTLIGVGYMEQFCLFYVFPLFHFQYKIWGGAYTTILKFRICKIFNVFESLLFDKKK